MLVLFLTLPSFPPAGTPKHLDYETVKADLNSVEGVKQAHSLHIWSLTLNRTALSAHLALGKLFSDFLFKCVMIISLPPSLLAPSPPPPPPPPPPQNLVLMVMMY